MKWKEFKDAVEAKGVKDEDEINYIDVTDHYGVFYITAEKMFEVSWDIDG